MVNSRGPDKLEVYEDDDDDNAPITNDAPGNNKDSSESTKCGCIPKRYQLALLMAVGFMVSFGIQFNLGIAIKETSHNRLLDVRTDKIRKFDWSTDTIMTMDSAFFWGYLVTQIPGALLAARYPAHRVFGIAIAVSALLNLLLAKMMELHSGYVVLIRTLQGLAEGVTYPACFTLLRHWAPPLERTRLATLTLTGFYAGALVGIPLTNWLIESWFGWESCIYLYGILGLIWSGVWLWLSHERPAQHPTISQAELRYIESSLRLVSPTPVTFQSTPWCAILRSMPVYAIIVAHFCRSWSFYLLLVSLPIYYREGLNFDLWMHGPILGPLAHLLMTILVPLGGVLADRLRTIPGRGLSTTNVRKVFNCGGFGMAGLLLILLGLITPKSWAPRVITALVLRNSAVIFSAFAISGFNVNHLDIAPRYAAILMGLSNTFATMAGLVFGVVLDGMIKDMTPNRWEDVFILTGVIQICGVVFYAVFGSGEVQPWAEPASNDVQLEQTTSQPSRDDRRIDF